MSAKSFPCLYWDKFIKKRVSHQVFVWVGVVMSWPQVRQKYADQFDQPHPWDGEVCSGASGQRTGRDDGYDPQHRLALPGVESWGYLHGQLVAVCVSALRIILQAITHNGKELVLTVGLLAIICYTYTVIAFNLFRKFYVLRV